MAGVVSAQPVTAGIEKKVSKYRALAQEAGLPLIVAAGADKFTGLQLQHFDDLLQGVATISVQFDFGDSFIHHPVEVDPFNPPRWTMPSALAGVLWVDNEFPFTTDWRPNPAARQPPCLPRSRSGRRICPTRSRPVRQRAKNRLPAACTQRGIRSRDVPVCFVRWL
ncbi:hypothetical protein ABZ572_37420 [Streptomyces sp. NPDC018338]|uniref:hypothetical protein n=1 Tax=Streptomyces sp. NPDC018338 TaxID=3157192 RepID=UPI0033E4B76A